MEMARHLRHPPTQLLYEPLIDHPLADCHFTMSVLSRSVYQGRSKWIELGIEMESSSLQVDKLYIFYRLTDWPENVR